MEEEETEFYLLVQRTKQRIALSERIRRTLRLFQGTPSNLKKFLGGEVSLDTLVIYDIIFEFSERFDKKLDDPV